MAYKRRRLYLGFTFFRHYAVPREHGELRTLLNIAVQTFRLTLQPEEKKNLHYLTPYLTQSTALTPWVEKIML